MKLVIDIPEEFEELFEDDRLEDFLARVASDMESFGLPMAIHRKEILTMLRVALKNGTPLPKGHGRLIDADELHQKIENIVIIDGEKWFTLMQKVCNRIADAPTIIERSGSE